MVSKTAITQEDAVPTLPREVLIVEDDPVLIRAYEKIAARYGFVVRTVSRTTEVLRLALAHRPDVIILDFELEDGQSLKLLRTLKLSPETADVPVAVVSGYLSPETLAGLEAIGNVPTLAKPWSVDQLLGLLLRLAAQSVPAQPRAPEKRS